MAQARPSSSLFCAVCLGEYKEPKILRNCGHSFCCPCLKEMKVFENSITCPLCRAKECLPQSGRVEDLPPNFALMNLSFDQEEDPRGAQVERKVPFLKRRRFDPERENHDPCCIHGAPTKFYCKTCKVQVCAECLLEGHKVGRHSIITAADAASDFLDELHKLNEDLKPLEQVKKNISDEISKRQENFQREKERVQSVVGNILQNKEQKLQNFIEGNQNKIQENKQIIEQLQRDNDDMQRRIDDHIQEIQQLYRDESDIQKKIEEWEATEKASLANLKKQFSEVNILSMEINGQCIKFNHHLSQKDLSLAGEVEQIHENIESLKTSINELQNLFPSTSNAGLSVVNTRHSKLGIRIGGR